jgi:histidinol-phosphate aminotransferase
MPLVTPSIEALRPYEPGKPVEEVARELGIADAVKLASNENPLGPSERVRDAIRAAAPTVGRYPDGGAFQLRQRIAHHHDVRPDEILLGAGSNEVLELLVRTFTTPAHHVVFGEPAFVVYRLASMAHGVPFTAVPLARDVHDLEAMAAAVTPETRLLFVANPNNPTGTHVGGEALRRLLGSVPEDVIVVLDEAYFEYADAPDYVSALSLRSLHERLVVCRTFSKIYGLAGLRVGYGIAPAPLVDYMNRVRMPFNIGTLGQVAALAALDDPDHVERSQELNRRERQRLTEALTGFGLQVTPSQANFVYVDVGRPAAPVYDGLLRQGVIVRPFGGLPTKLRITVGTQADNDRLLGALSEVLS